MHFLQSHLEFFLKAFITIAMHLPHTSREQALSYSIGITLSDACVAVHCKVDKHINIYIYTHRIG